MYGQLPVRWNCLDGRGATPWIENMTGLVHYTDMSGQVNRPYPEALKYHRHHVPRLEEVWMDCYYDMAEDGLIPSPCTLDLNHIANADDPSVLSAFETFKTIYESETTSGNRYGPNLYA